MHNRRKWTLRIWDYETYATRRFRSHPDETEITNLVASWISRREIDDDTSWDSIMVYWELISPDDEVVANGNHRHDIEYNHMLAISNASPSLRHCGGPRRIKGITPVYICGYSASDHDWVDDYDALARSNGKSVMIQQCRLCKLCRKYRPVPGHEGGDDVLRVEYYFRNGSTKTAPQHAKKEVQ